MKYDVMFLIKTFTNTFASSKSQTFRQRFLNLKKCFIKSFINHYTGIIDFNAESLGVRFLLTCLNFRRLPILRNY